MRLRLFFALLPLALWACQDELPEGTEGTEDVPRPRLLLDAAAQGRSDIAPITPPRDQGVVTVDAAPIVEDAEIIEPVADAAPPEEDALVGECRHEDERCVGDDMEVCINGSWIAQPCEEGARCQGARCAPIGCEPGQRACLGPRAPAVCQGGDWVEEADPCHPDQICYDGFCGSPECATAAQRRSYLGCDYLAMSLPNAIFDPAQGSTDGAPIGLVLTNPSPTQTAIARVFTPDGEQAALVDQQRISIPQIADDLNLSPVTVRSEILDADGEVFAIGLSSADRVPIPPGGLATLLLENRGAPSTGTTLRPEAWRVRSDGPVAAYQFNPYCCNYSFSNDASLLIPTTALGTDYLFLGVPHWFISQGLQTASNPAGIVIIASQDGTEVTVTLSESSARNISAVSEGQVQLGGGRVVARLQAQEALTIQTTPNQGGMFEPSPVQPDLSGSHIQATAPVAVFSNHQCTFYPSDEGACDHLEEQLFPTDVWGGSYVLTPTVRRGDTDREVTYWKIIARSPDADVQLSAPFDSLNPLPPGYAGVPDCADKLTDAQTLRLDGEGFCEFGTQRPVQITSGVSLMVMGIISGQGTAVEPFEEPFGRHAGDPAIFLLPPDHQYRSAYAFLVPDTYVNDYVTIVSGPETEITLDGQPLDLSGATPVPGSGRVFKHFQVEDGAHRLEGNQPFGIIVFAFDDFVSYAFTGGLNLIK